MTLSEMRTILQFASVAIIIATMIIQMKHLTLSTRNIGYVLAFTFWLFHALIFYVFVFLNQFGIFSVYNIIPSNTWSSGLRFHGFVTVFGVELSRLLTLKFKKDGHGG